ncbi:MAG: hypothetical protein ACTSUE_15815 [Promethearchaeota archaeon]
MILIFLFVLIKGQQHRTMSMTTLQNSDEWNLVDEKLIEKERTMSIFGIMNKTITIGIATIRKWEKSPYPSPCSFYTLELRIDYSSRHMFSEMIQRKILDLDAHHCSRVIRLSVRNAFDLQVKQSFLHHEHLIHFKESDIVGFMICQDRFTFYQIEDEDEEDEDEDGPSDWKSLFSIMINKEIACRTKENIESFF